MTCDRSILSAAALCLAACASPDASSTPAAIVEQAPPAPYTAAQIRAAHPDGTVLRMRVVQPGTEPIVTHTRFVDGDADGVTITSGNETVAGEAPSSPMRLRSTWVELRDHAKFPPARTTRQRARCTIAGRSYECWRYVVRAADDGMRRSEFWFALEKPGPPVLTVQLDGDRELARMEMVEYAPGS